MKRLRVAVIGCVRFSQAMLDELILMETVDICGVVTRRMSPNSDFCDLAQAAKLHGIPTLYASANEQSEMPEWIKGRQPDILLCVGWPYLLKADVLAAPLSKAIGYHPALLPRNRGRHPIIWALALGLAETGSTFFEMAEGADSGPILSQDRIAIAPEDDAATLYSKVEATARRQLRQLIQQLLAGIAKPVPQSEALATHWRKRGKSDGRIDWRMPAVSIHNLVRALVRPYPGAHFDHKNTEVKVWKTSVGKQGYIDMEPGFVLGLDAERLHVQCGGGSTIHLVAHELRSPVSRGDYL